MAPLQKREWWGLGVGIVWAVVTTAVFLAGGGVDKFENNSSFRLGMDALYIGWLVVYAVVMAPVTKFVGVKNDKVVVDERDRVIIARVPLIQLWAVIAMLVAWTIGLTEVYHNAGQIPTTYLYLIFFTTLAVSTIVQSAGILIGYWRMNLNA
jgi:hypothetical protein